MGDASDLDHLTYAAEQKRTLVSMDDDFLRLHHQWLSEYRDHAGIIRLPHHLQGEDGIGTIVRTLFEYYEIIESDAGTLEEDIFNRVIFVG